VHRLLWLAVSGPSASDFRPGAAVHSSDGVHVGELQRVVVDAGSWELRTIVVKETRRFSGHVLKPGVALMSDEIIVPVASVAGVAHARIDLALTSAEVRRLPLYLSYEYAPVTRDDVVEEVVGALSAIPPVTAEVEKAAKSADELEITAGESVMLGHSGRRLGRVRDILFDGRELVGIVMRPDGFFKEDVVLQVRFLDRSDDAALFARLRDEDLEQLTPFHPAD
jgi:sporulation protein YlmC with PRC-barrel domain